MSIYFYDDNNPLYLLNRFGEEVNEIFKMNSNYIPFYSEINLQFDLQNKFLLGFCSSKIDEVFDNYKTPQNSLIVFLHH